MADGRWRFRKDEDISDDRLVAFINAEAVADDPSLEERDKAGKDFEIEILKQKFGGAGVSPSADDRARGRPPR